MPASNHSHSSLFLSDKEIISNIEIIDADIAWVTQILQHRIEELGNPALPKLQFLHTAPPLLHGSKGPYAQLVNDMQLSPVERLLLITSLIPHYAPEVFTSMLRHESNPLALKFYEAGGFIEPTFQYFVPTFKTVLFLLSEEDSLTTSFCRLALNKESKLFKEQVITMNNLRLSHDENMLTQVPMLAAEYVHFFKTSQKPRPDFGKAFPASLVTTAMNWDDLVLPEATIAELEFIKEWMKSGKKLISLDERANKSFPCLFYGPPGTGKSLAAKLIGKEFGKDVFRIDLSMIVSKYIGETEKNLAYLFNRAEGKDWILFFDEADALFGKRTAIGDAKDKWANLEMSYLLQRMEEYTGLTILATNFRNNLDPAMIRRFQAMIHFPRPEHKERELLWNKLIPAYFKYDPSIHPEKLARYEFTGANIANIIKGACLDAISTNTSILSADALVRGIKREFTKESRTP